MPRAQTGITSLPPENALILSFSIEDLPLRAMSIGHIAANVPGLANEIRESASGSDLLYSVGFSSLLWNFIWQGNLPPGFRPLEFEDENDDEDEDDEDDEDEMSSGSDLTFCFFSSNPDLLHHLAEESQAHLKNIARVHEMALVNLVPNSPSQHLDEKEKAIDTVVIGPEHPEFSQSSFLFTLSLNCGSNGSANPSPAEQETHNQNLAEHLLSLTANESGLFHHLYSCPTGNECGHYLLALSNRVDPFQNILDATLTASADSLKTSFSNMQITPTLHFLPSLEILAALRMGTLRMGPLSPTAKWK